MVTERVSPNKKNHKFGTQGGRLIMEYFLKNLKIINKIIVYLKTSILTG